MPPFSRPFVGGVKRTRKAATAAPAPIANTDDILSGESVFVSGSRGERWGVGLSSHDGLLATFSVKAVPESKFCGTSDYEFFRRQNHRARVDMGFLVASNITIYPRPEMLVTTQQLTVKGNRKQR